MCVGRVKKNRLTPTAFLDKVRGAEQHVEPYVFSGPSKRE